jgi:hypothetical protein
VLLTCFKHEGWWLKMKLTRKNSSLGVRTIKRDSRTGAIYVESRECAADHAAPQGYTTLTSLKGIIQGLVWYVEPRGLVTKVLPSSSLLGSINVKLD